MHIIVGNNNELLKSAVLSIRHSGTESESGNSQINQDGTRFIDGVILEVTNPQDRWLSLEGRLSSALAAIGEVFWVLAGRNDVAFLSRVLGRAKDFSDDGLTWRGAYGPRIYGNGQLDSVIERLRKNPNTRQAYLTIYDPALDSDQGLAKTHPEGKAVTKDMICNFALLFSIRDGKLDITVNNRSQDVLWGMSSINFIEFSIIQELVARMLGVGVGHYKLFSNNIHYYNNEVSSKQLNKITGETTVNVSSSTDILVGSLRNQDDLKWLFSDICLLLERGCDFIDIFNVFYGRGIEGGLLIEMAYVLWSALNSQKVNAEKITDEGLLRALRHTRTSRTLLGEEE